MLLISEIVRSVRIDNVCLDVLQNVTIGVKLQLSTVVLLVVYLVLRMVRGGIRAKNLFFVSFVIMVQLVESCT